MTKNIENKKERKLTIKQSNYLKYRELGNSQTVAYQLAYDTDTTKTKTIKDNAYKLESTPTIAQSREIVLNTNVHQDYDSFLVELNFNKTKASKLLIDIAQSNRAKDRDKIGALKLLGLWARWENPIILEQNNVIMPLNSDEVTKSLGVLGYTRIPSDTGSVVDTVYMPQTDNSDSVETDEE